MLRLETAPRSGTRCADWVVVRAAHQAGHIQFTGRSSPLAGPAAWRTVVEPRDFFLPQPLAKEARDKRINDLNRSAAIQRAGILIAHEPRED